MASPNGQGPRFGSITRQGVSYVAIGVSSALMDLGLFELLYAVFDVDIALSNPIALLGSTVFNFLMNRSVTFQSTSNPIRSMVLYAALLGLNMLVSTAAISAMVQLGAPSPAAKVVMQACVACWNFFVYRAVIFK